MARRHHKVNTTFLSLYFPLMNPFRHLPSRMFTTHIHRRHHLGPIERHGETRKLVEGRVFRVRDTIDLNRRGGFPRRMEVGVGKVFFVNRSCEYTGHARCQVCPSRLRISFLKEHAQNDFPHTGFLIYHSRPSSRPKPNGFGKYTFELVHIDLESIRRDRAERNEMNGRCKWVCSEHGFQFLVIFAAQYRSFARVAIDFAFQGACDSFHDALFSN